jgi:adenylylsulfate kinase-like enzyme
MKFKRKNGIIFWTTGISGSGKSTLNKLIYPFIKKKFGPTLLLSGDDLRKTFQFNEYDKNYRLKVGKQYTNFLKLISKYKINVLFSVVGLFNELHKFNKKNLKNYVEIFIDANFKKTEIRKQKFFYKKKISNVWGRDIRPEFPKKPHIIIKNNYEKSIYTLSKELKKKINNLKINFI